MLCICGDAACDIPYGLCHCGCREQTRIAAFTHRAVGQVRGMPLKRIPGHGAVKRRPPIIQPKNGSIRLIALTQGKVARVSKRKYKWAKQWHWHAWWSEANDTWYARRKNDKGKSPAVVYMHNEMLRPPKGFIVDHRDGDGLNNVDRNLRIATHSQNMMNTKVRSDNTSGFRGVCWIEDRNLWRFSVQAKGEVVQGYHRSLEEAVAARDAAAKKLHGAFARLVKDE